MNMWRAPGHDGRPTRRHSALPPRHAGFTMVELIVVMILVGILGAIGAARFFSRTGFDADAFTEQARAMLRYAQKLAVAQNRPVYVQASSGGVALCFSKAAPCAQADQVPAPSGSNSGSAETRTFCVTDGAFAAHWYCEAPPAGASFSANPAGAGTFYFNGLGRPYMAGDAGPDSSFGGLQLATTFEAVTRTVAVSVETGYVY